MSHLKQVFNIREKKIYQNSAIKDKDIYLAGLYAAILYHTKYMLVCQKALTPALDFIINFLNSQH